MISLTVSGADSTFEQTQARPQNNTGHHPYSPARSHTVSQGIEGTTGSYWHGIMHRREGDFSNSHYWFNKVGGHPVIDEVEGPHGELPQDLVATQRREWQTLFGWCVKQDS